MFYAPLEWNQGVYKIRMLDYVDHVSWVLIGVHFKDMKQRYFVFFYKRRLLFCRYIVTWIVQYRYILILQKHLPCIATDTLKTYYLLTFSCLSLLKKNCFNLTEITIELCSTIMHAIKKFGPEISLQGSFGHRHVSYILGGYELYLHHHRFLVKS